MFLTGISFLGLLLLFTFGCLFPLNVMCEGAAFGNATILNHPQDTAVACGETVHLKCVFDQHVLKSSCIWHLNKKSVQVDKGRYFFANESNSTSDCSLTIKNTKFEYDQGSWICGIPKTSKEVSSLQSQQAVLSVLCLTINRNHSTENTYSCETKGFEVNNETQITWERQVSTNTSWETVGHGQVIKIQPFDGELLCVAKRNSTPHMIRSHTVNLTKQASKPNTAMEKNVSATCGKSISLFCDLSPSTPGDCSWTKDNKAVNIVDRYNFINKTAMESCSIRIDNYAQTYDDGRWKCKLANTSSGEFSYNVYMQICKKAGSDKTVFIAVGIFCGFSFVVVFYFIRKNQRNMTETEKPRSIVSRPSLKVFLDASEAPQSILQESSDNDLNEEHIYEDPWEYKEMKMIAPKKIAVTNYNH